MGFIFQVRKEGKRKYPNLVHQSGNGVLEFVGDVDQAIEVVSFVEIDNTFSADRCLISFTEGVDLLMRMLLTVKNPGGR